MTASVDIITAEKNCIRLSAETDFKCAKQCAEGIARPMKRWIVLSLAICASSLSLALTSKEQQWVDAVKATYGQRAGKRVETWRRKMAELAPASEQEQLKEVNAFLISSTLSTIFTYGARKTTGRPLRISR